MSKVAIRYYSRDIGLQRDRKFVKLRFKFGYWAIAVYEILLDLIYADKGYYIEYNEDNKDSVVFDVMTDLQGKYQPSAETVDEIISGLVDSGLFSVCHYKLGYLTSHRLQEFFYKYTVERKNVEVDPEIWMLTFSEMQDISDRSSILSFLKNRPIFNENRPNFNENRPNLSLKESKEKESKEKESKEKESKEKEISLSKDNDCRAVAQRIAIAWNDLTDFGIKAVSRISSGTKRYDSLMARVKQYGEDDIYLAINNIKNSKFLQGENKSGWTITFDWFVKPNNFIKVLEGNYVNTGGREKTEEEKKYDEWADFFNRRNEEEHKSESEADVIDV